MGNPAGIHKLYNAWGNSGGLQFIPMAEIKSGWFKDIAADIEKEANIRR